VVKLKSPMMSLDASGSVGKAITFSKWKGRNYVRKLVIPHNPQSGLQTGMRAWLTWLSKYWAVLSAGDKAVWAAYYPADSISGINSFVKFNQLRVRRNLGIYTNPTNTPAAAEAAPGTNVATAATKSVNLTWVDSAGANDKATVIYMSTTTGFTPDISNAVLVVNHGVQKATITRLKTGTPYYFRLGGVAYEGTLGTLAAQVTATPT